MKAYPLRRLLALREHRVETARAEVAGRRRLLAEAVARAEEAEKTAREFAENRPKEEAALFERIRNQVLERKRLDRFHEEIAALAARELELFDLAEAEAARVREAEKALEAALAAQQEAMREVRKFEEHRAIWWQAEKKRREDIQELEAEEVAGITAMRRKEQ
jgi:Zn-dependent M32 family carboxypeptidase